jgi:hypothetical protein
MLRPRHTGKEAVQILHTCTRTGLRPVDRPKDLWWGIPVLPPEVLERIELHQEFTLKRRRNPIWQSAPVSALQGFSYDRNTLCCTALYCVSSVQLIALCCTVLQQQQVAVVAPPPATVEADKKKKKKKSKNEWKSEVERASLSLH